MFEPLTGAGRLKSQNAAKTTSSATTDGIIIFIGLKLAGACGGGICVWTGTVTGALREVATGGCSSLVLTIVTSSGPSLVAATPCVLVIPGGAARLIVIP